MKYFKGFLLLALMFMGGMQSTLAQSVDVSELYNNSLIAKEKGDIGAAVYDLELAKLYEPYAQDIGNNLSIMRQEVDVDVIPVPRFFLARWIDRLANVMLPSYWRYLFVALLLATVGVLFLYYIRRTMAKKGFSLMMGMLSVLLLVSLLLGIRRANMLSNGKYAIVMDKAARALYEGPDTVSEQIKDISAGVKLEIVDEVEGWYKVIAMDKEGGWIPQKSIKRIKAN